MSTKVIKPKKKLVRVKKTVIKPKNKTRIKNKSKSIFHKKKKGSLLA